MRRWPLVLLVVALGALVLGTAWFYRAESGRAFLEAELDLQSMAQLKAGRLENWRAERLGDAAVIAESPALVQPLLRLLEDEETEVGAQVKSFFRSLSRRYKYSNVILTDCGGRVVASLDGYAVGARVHEEAVRTIERVERMGAPALTRLHESSGREPHMSAVAPLLDDPGGRMAGALILLSRAEDFLYPVLDEWPVPRDSAETLLVRVENGNVLFLNPLRHDASPPLSLRIPLSQKEVPAVMAADGMRGVVRGLDYRGEPVLAALVHIPDSPWLMVSKIDEAEALADWHWQARTILGFAGMLALGLLGIAGAFLVLRERGHLQKELELERRWQSARESLEFAQHAARMGSWECDLRTGEVTWSRELYRLAGIEAGAKTPTWPELVAHVHVEDRELVDRSRSAVLESGESIEISFRTAPGPEGRPGVRHYVARAQPIRDESGQVARVVGSVQDVTETRRREEDLELAKHCIDKAALAVFSLDDDGAINMVNEQACRSLGYTREELTQLSVTDIDPNFSIESFRKHRRIVRERGSRRIETLHRHKDGSEFPVEVTVTRTAYRGRDFTFSFARDLSEHKRTEAEKEALQAQLLQSQKMEAIGRLAGGVAHDFNNMLQTIQGTAEMALLELEDKSPLKESFLQIQQAAEKSSDLTRQLLAFARRQTVAPRVIDLNDAVAGLLRMLRRLLGEDIEIEWHPGRRLWPVKMDASQLDQILANLVVNARDAIEDEGVITIETENVTFDAEYCRVHAGAEMGDYVRLTLSDNGRGMGAETLGQIFEPFFTTKSPGSGTGLGLSTVYGIVKQNRGYVNAYSEEGKGSSFRIYLPRFLGALPKLESADEDPIPRGIETVLVAEDDPAILRVTQRMLEELGYTVLAAKGGSEAVELVELHDGHLHLLLTDVVMPDMNGKQLHEQVVERVPAIRTIYMSGYTANVIARHGVLDAGVHFIQKPFSIRELGEAVRATLDDTTSKL